MTATKVMHRKLVSALLAGLIAGFALAPSAQATGDVWVEGSYEFLNLPNVQFINNYFPGGANAAVRQEFVNDDGDFDGFRIDGGIANIPILGGAYVMDVKGFFAWHDDKSELECRNTTAVPGRFCAANPLIDNPNLIQFVGTQLGTTQLFTTDRDVNHWGVALEVARGPMGLKAGPAFRRIDQDLTITGQAISFGGTPDPFQLTYSEDLETNYWGAFVGADGAIDLGGGWSLQGDAEAGLYWADTNYSGNYVVTNALVPGIGLNPNVTQQLSLDSNELAFIGTFKAALEKDFGMFKLAGFGRVEYISSAPDVGYNDLDLGPGAFVLQGSEDETRIGERYAVAASAGVRLSVPMGSGQ